MKVKVRNLRVGDGVDLLSFPPDYPFDDITRQVAEFQSAEVIGENDGSPFVVETASCWVLCTDQGGFGIDPNWEVEVTR